MLVGTSLFHLDALNWLLGRFSVYLAVAFLVIFQPEIRRVLAEIGKQHIFAGPAADQQVIDSIVEAGRYPRPPQNRGLDRRGTGDRHPQYPGNRRDD